jgi:hypothetical protein
LPSGNIKEGFRGVKAPYVLTPAPLYFVKRGINLLDEHSNPNEV